MSNPQQTENTAAAETVDDAHEDTAPVEDTTVEAADTDDDTGDDHDDRGDRGDIAKARAQAAKYRARLREAEAERDTLAQRITATEHATVEHVLTEANLDPRLWKAAEVNLDDHRTEAGALDITALIDKARQVRHELVGVKPNPQQGIPSAATGAAQLADVFRQPPSRTRR